MGPPRRQTGLPMLGSPEIYSRHRALRLRCVPRPHLKNVAVRLFLPGRLIRLVVSTIQLSEPSPRSPAVTLPYCKSHK